MPDPKEEYPRKRRIFGNKKPSKSIDDTQKTISEAPLTFVEARRRKNNSRNIYDTLIQELYEEGCVRSARHFRCLVDRESELHLHESIRDRVKDDIDLLMALYENALNAEKAAFFQNCAGLSTSYRLLYQIIVLLEAKSNSFEWLLEKAYKIIVRIVEKKDTAIVGSPDIEARIFLKYGIYLGELGENLKTALYYLNKAMELSKGQKWFEDSSMYSKRSADITDRPLRTLSEVASFYLAKKSLKYAQRISLQTPQRAAELAQKATKIVAQVGIESNKGIFFASCIASATYLKESKLYLKALKMLSTIDKFFPNEDFAGDEMLLMMKCELLIIRGSCHSSLNQMREAKAEHQEAIKIAKANGFKFHEAESHLSIGKFYYKNKQPIQAKSAFQDAKKLFEQVHNKRNAKKTLYLLAKLQADELFPFFLDLLKDDSKCGFYKLRQWKNLCKPFWIDMMERNILEQKDDIYCLLVPDVKKSRLTFQGGHLSKVASIFRHRNSKFVVLEDRFV